MNPTELQRLRDCLGYFDMIRNNLIEVDAAKFAEEIMELDFIRDTIQHEVALLMAFE